MMNELKLPLRGQVPFEKALLEGQNISNNRFNALSYVYEHRAF